jgi:hypothetical protein
MPVHTEPANPQELAPRLKSNRSSREDTEKATAKFRDLADQPQDSAGRPADQGREASDKVQEAAGDMKGTVDQSLKTRPTATPAVAAASV